VTKLRVQGFVEYKCGEYGDSRFHHKNTMIVDTKPNTPDSRDKIESARFCGIQMWRRWRFKVPSQEHGHDGTQQ
jgi:hypothetical protein